MSTVICVVCQKGLASNMTSSSSWQLAHRCGHIFHRECLLNYFITVKATDQKCPNCKMPCKLNETNEVFPTVRTNPPPIPAPITKCPKKCAPKHAVRLRCLMHKRCGSDCKDFHHNLIQVFDIQINGWYYCQQCVKMKCPTCDNRISGDCVIDADGTVYHEECFPCVSCNTPLDSDGESLTKKSNQYHHDCLTCDVCGINVAGYAYRFVKDEPRCLDCSPQN